MKNIILPFSRRSMALLPEYIFVFQCNLYKFILDLNSFSVYINAFCYSLLAFQPPTPHLLSLDIILLCFISVSLFPSFSIQKKCCIHHFQLQSIPPLQLIDSLKIAAIRPELLFARLGAKLIWGHCSDSTKQYELCFHLCCYFCFLPLVIMRLPAFLPHSVSSFFIRKCGKACSLGTTFSFYLYSIFTSFSLCYLYS